MSSDVYGTSNQTVDKSKLVHSNESCLYLCGQSLGLKPKSVNQNVEEVLNSWGSKGVHSHFNGFLPAALSDIPAKGPMARLVGAKESEIALMNGLTVNLHLLFATFYRPTPQRHKIIIEEHSFSSDMVCDSTLSSLLHFIYLCIHTSCLLSIPLET